MRRLMLLRHAKTERDSATGADRDRRLDARGRQDAADLGRWLARKKQLPDLVLVSTAVRARETWDLLAEALPDIAVEHVPDLYGADPSELLRIVHAAGESAERLMVVAHNPGLHELALGLIAKGAGADEAALAENLPTAGFVAIDFAGDDWHDVAFRRGSLQCFVSPRLLRSDG